MSDKGIKLAMIRGIQLATEIIEENRDLPIDILISTLKKTVGQHLSRLDQ